MNKKIFAVICMALSLLSCKKDRTDYKAYYNQAVKELSSKQYYGRSVYGNGDIKAAKYIIDQISGLRGLQADGRRSVEQNPAMPPYKSKVLPAGEGRWADVKGNGKYLPYLQNFSFPMNLMWGDMSVSVDGKELRATYDFTAKEFSPTCHGEFNVVYMPDDKINEQDFITWLDSGKYKDCFVVLSWQMYKTLPAHPFERYLPYLGQLKNVGGIILNDSDLFPYFKARSYYTTNMPVLMAKNFPQDAKRIKVDIDAEMMQSKDSHNIIAWLPGTDLEEEDYYTFIAHYDHLDLMGRDNVFSGANDNASGAAMLLTLAKYFTAHRPEHPIQFIWLDAEESNLLGAFYYCENPVRPLDNIELVIDLDMIADNSDHLATECNVEGLEELDDLIKLNADGTFPPFDIALQEFTDNSDQYAFGEKDVPSLYFSTEGDYLKDYHTPRDTYDNSTDSNFDRLFSLLIRYIND